MQVLLAKPRGFCAGVDRAIEIVERALSIHGAPIYVRHEVVHNKFVVDDLRAKGIEPFLVSRTNREIVKNFKRASRFGARILLDVGGTVGNIAGAWQQLQPVATWTYALVDREFRLLWVASADQPMAYDGLIKELKKAR